MDDDKLREEFPGNTYTNVERRSIDNDISPDKSKKQKREQGKGGVREKQKTVGEKIAESFLMVDKEEIGNHLIFDCLIPGIKDAINNVVHMWLYGGDPGRAPSSRSSTRGSKLRRIPYDGIYEDNLRRKADPYYPTRGTRKPELIFDYKEDAVAVKNDMESYILEYHKITLKQFYSIVSERTAGRENEINIPTDWTQERYGWYTMEGVRVVSVRGGYLLDVPRADIIERY